MMKRPSKLSYLHLPTLPLPPWPSLLFGPLKQTHLSCEYCPVGRWCGWWAGIETGSDRSAKAVLTFSAHAQEPCLMIGAYTQSILNTFETVTFLYQMQTHLKQNKACSFVSRIYMAVSQARCVLIARQAVGHSNSVGFSTLLRLLPSCVHGLIICNAFPNASCLLTIEKTLCSEVFSTEKTSRLLYLVCS